MDHSISIWLVFVAGLASIFSPCVLPVVPIVVAGGGNDHRLRPVLVVGGLAFTFVLMGIVSSLFGATIGPAMRHVEKAAGILIVLFGLLLMLNINLFKHAGFLSQFAGRTRGSLGGFLLGAVLGIIWIPCVGPMLSGVLAMVASQGRVATGAALLSVYSLGFAVPMLIAGYASHFFRKRLHGAGKHPVAVNIISGAVLVALGVLIVTRGIAGLNF